jgi:hypothetical protein
VSIESTIVGEDSMGAEGVLGIFKGTFFLIGNVRCCIMNLHKLVSATGDPCKDKRWNAYIEARRLLEGLLGAIACKEWETAAAIKAQLVRLCNNNGANCGC